MKHTTVYTGLAACLLALTTSAAPVLDLDFTAAEGFSDGADVQGIQGMNAQGSWDAGDTGGTGYVASTNGYQRARNYASFTLETNHSVIIETTLRLTDGDGLYSNADNFKIGFAENSQHSGANTPSIGATIHTFSDGSYWFGGDTADSRISVSAGNNGDWIKFTQTITRSATASNFTGHVSASNLTDGVDLGSTAALWTESTDDGSWGGAMRPSFRAWANTANTGLQIDRWVVSTSTNGPPPEVIETNTVDVTVDLTHQLYIGGISTFKRDRVVNWHETGKYSDFSAHEAALMIDTNKARFGRSVGGMQWIRNQVQDEDPLRPGYINTNSLASWCQSHQDGLVNDWPWIKLGYQPLIYTDHTTIHPDENSNTGIFNPINNEAVAEWAATVWANYWTTPKRPRYYEPVNEPFVHIANKQHVVDMYDAVIDRMHQDVPDVQVGGPCMAYPAFSNSGYGLFADRMGRYIDNVGDTTDFISWHIYSTFYDDGDPESHSVGANADWQLDLVENYAFNQTGREIPIVISEFGGGFKNHESSVAWSTYSPLRDWYILKSVMGKTMTFFERPDRIEKTIPFISGKATWYPGYESNAYPWVTFHLNGGIWEETHLTKYYGFWKEVAGDRFPIETSDPDVQAHAFVTNSTVYLCLNNIDAFDPAIINMAGLFESGMSVQTSTVTRLYWNGSSPILEEHAAMGTWSNLTLQAEEAAIVKLTLNQAPTRSQQLYQKSHYGDQTILAYSGTPRTFTVLADMHRGAIHKALLKVGVTRDFGTDVAPIVTFNGTLLPQAADWPGGTQQGVSGGAGGRDQFDGVIRMDVPAYLVQATNTVDVSFATSGGFIATVILDVTSELPFEVPFQADLAAAGYIFNWDSSAALEYVISKSTNLVSGSWNPEATLPGTGGPLSHTNATLDSSAFFKLDSLIP